VETNDFEILADFEEHVGDYGPERPPKHDDFLRVAMSADVAEIDNDLRILLLGGQQASRGVVVSREELDRILKTLEREVS
jgi:hypothetical protein